MSHVSLSLRESGDLTCLVNVASFPPILTSEGTLTFLYAFGIRLVPLHQDLASYSHAGGTGRADFHRHIPEGL